MTETLLAWAVEPIACTRFCEQPDLRHVGGTKDPDIPAIVELRPDLVVMCDEENRKEDADALVASGVAVHSCSPRSVREVAPALVDLATTLDITPPPVDPGGRAGRPDPALWSGAPGAAGEKRTGATGDPSGEGGGPALGLRAFVPVWRRPWISLAGDTYGSSVLETLGLVNVFAAASDRYPEVDLDQARAGRPDVVVAPSEPYPFRERHVPELATVAPVALVDGRDLFWWGVRTPAALVRLRHALTPFTR